MDTQRRKVGIGVWLLFLGFLMNQRDSASALNPDPQGQHTGEEECCACGHAMYAVEFKGMWSRNTHPKGFPDEKNSFQLHWSNLVGASHSNDFRIWDYGQFASRAVKEVCEYGSSRSLENEIKKSSKEIRTVIKTKQLWGPKRILETLKAVYTVNKKKHLLSLITMVGPSPDWCLGISAQSMCNANCTWKDSLDIFLYPWDAGTDSRVTYLGPKRPTQPPERIHRLTNTFPNDRDSPFYGEEIKPFAKLTLRKKKEACTDDDGKSTSGERTPTTDELVSEMKKKMMMNKKFEMEKCATSQWSDWSECSNPCGNGMRERRRMLKNPEITADMCGLDLEESETCVGDCKNGRVKKLRDDFIMRHDIERDPNDECAVTDWSAWSPCSATCGLGMKERWRMFLFNPENTVDCGIHLMEKDLCRGPIFDCQKAIMMKNYTAVCSTPADVGPCRGNFRRWFYNHTMQKCQVFSYGGCRGNDNRFETQSECLDLCAEHMASLHRKDHMMQKPDMPGDVDEMEMVLQRDKERMMAKQRMMEKQATMENDMRMKQEMMRKRKMMEEQKRQMMEEQKRQMMEEQKRQMMEDQKRKMMEEQKRRMMEDQKRKEMEMRKAADMERQMKQKQMMLAAQNQVNSDLSSPASQMEREKARMMRKQRRMMKKKQKMERRKRRRRRQRRRRPSDENGPLNDGGSRGQKVNCMVTPWTEWSECSASCGRGFIIKSRMVKVHPQNGGRRCPRRMERKKRCRQKKCPVNCQMSEWGEWAPCSHTCGAQSVQIRRRRRLKKPKRGGLACPSKKEKRFCSVPLCPDSNMEESMSQFEYRLYQRQH